MKKSCKRIATAALALILVLSACVPAFAAGKTTYKPVNTYLCIGDSIAAGCGLMKDGSDSAFTKEGRYDKIAAPETYYWGYDFAEAPNAYHSLVADKLTNKFGQPTELIQAARSSMRAVELRYLLDGKTYNDYDEDRLWGNTYFYFEDGNDTFSVSDLDALNRRIANAKGGDYAELVEKADLITLNVGANDVFSSGLSILGKQLNDGTITGLSQQFRSEVNKILAQGGDLGAALVKIVDISGSIDDAKAIVAAVTKILEQNFLQFQINYVAVLQQIKTLNPKANVQLLGVYNPLNKVQLSSDGTVLGNLIKENVKLGTLMQGMTSRVNLFISQCATSYNYQYVNVADAEVYGMSLDDTYFWENFSIKMHPTKEGHRTMASRILKNLEKNYIDGDLFQDGSVTDADAIYLWNHQELVKQINNSIPAIAAQLTQELNKYYPLNQPVDFNGDGVEDSDDAVYLLNYTLLPERYPLEWWK